MFLWIHVADDVRFEMLRRVFLGALFVVAGEEMIAKASIEMLDATHDFFRLGRRTGLSLVGIGLL